MALKHGYRTVEEYKAGVQKKFSLLENGILSKPCTRLLLVNVSVAGRDYGGVNADVAEGREGRTDAHRGLDDALRTWVAQGRTVSMGSHRVLGLAR